jgi:hypothetical protein
MPAQPRFSSTSTYSTPAIFEIIIALSAILPWHAPHPARPDFLLWITVIADGEFFGV